MNQEGLERNRGTLIAALKPKDQAYIRDTWQSKERRVIWLYTKFYPALPVN